jgi:hypothetical protein
VDDDEWVPIEFPPNLMEMLEAWRTSEEPHVGWCLLCNRPIKCEADIIAGTNTHDCREGRTFEKSQKKLVAGKSGKGQPQQCGRRRTKVKLRRQMCEVPPSLSERKVTSSRTHPTTPRR